ncbi:MAG: alpha-L-fucosidase [Pirellulales bacterium]|nr:alpha-L-fucosidase [Pirellulales bacterium]
MTIHSLQRQALVVISAFSVTGLAAWQPSRAEQADVEPPHRVSTESEPMASGPFSPSWSSLAAYEAPDWFRDAKFGIWAHWGPQCAPEAGDWYARHMYSQGHWQYESHLKNYGHPSEFGFKDVIRSWKAERWNPEELVALYKRAGAMYFVAMANHHDNFDLWNSKHQPWNSVALGPKQDLVGRWARAARDQGLRFGVTVHAAHAWLWYETAQGADATGSKAGVPYDGRLRKSDGQGTWWDGLDPQDLYEQAHEPSRDFADLNKIHGRWNWTGDGSVPDAAYCQRFYNRTVDLINQHDPDLLYFDDTALPLWPASDAGLTIAAHFYNRNMARREGRLQAVLCGKILDQQQRQCMIWDIERGHSNRIEPFPWQTDTCIGDWHYNRDVYNRRRYKSAHSVVHMLIDIVSKNGNLLLNVPVRSDGTIDDQERAIVEEIAEWTAVNGKAIYGTRPWIVFGEGPAMDETAELSAQGFNEGKGKPLTAADYRFVARGDSVFAFAMGRPGETAAIASLGNKAGLLQRKIVKVRLAGGDEPLDWSQENDALVIKVPTASLPARSEFATCFEIILTAATDP